ncbi:hypothetical protein Hanom_Chr02g00159781 [Helianthus anomalus]
MLSKTQGVGEAHRPRPEPRRKAKKKTWAFLRKAHIEKKNIKNMLWFENK